MFAYCVCIGFRCIADKIRLRCKWKLWNCWKCHIFLASAVFFEKIVAESWFLFWFAHWQSAMLYITEDGSCFTWHDVVSLFAMLCDFPSLLFYLVDSTLNSPCDIVLPSVHSTLLLLIALWSVLVQEWTFCFSFCLYKLHIGLMSLNLLHCSHFFQLLLQKFCKWLLLRIYCLLDSKVSSGGCAKFTNLVGRKMDYNGYCSNYFLLFYVFHTSAVHCLRDKV